LSYSPIVTWPTVI
jgi:hypothetical protein